MIEVTPRTFDGTCYVGGTASGKLLASDLELSFWGGVDPESGEVIDRFHPLSGVFLKDAILAIPGGRGSCTGSATILELILNGLGPKALIFERFDEIITLGVLVAEEFFEKKIPVIALGVKAFVQIQELNQRTVHVRDNQISNLPLGASVIHDVEPAGIALCSSNFRLSDLDQKFMSGGYGEAVRVSMKIVVRLASMMGAEELVDVSQAHVDGAWYGPGSVEFAKKLRDLGARFRVPTTLNAINIDQRRWRSFGIDKEYGETCDELARTFLDIGAQNSFTCAPYLLETAPNPGDSIAWGESNAVVYANSVLGAKTLKNSNMLECLIALTGRGPKSGVCIDANRLASVWIRVPAFRQTDDSFWPVLGYSVGAIARHHIPVITGLETLTPSRDDFKAFSAAFATSSGAPMFHIVNLTQEAPSLGAVCPESKVPEAIDTSVEMLRSCWEEFNHGYLPQQVDLISLGNPHLSFGEIRKLAGLCRGRIKHQAVGVMITCGRSQYGLAAQAGFVQELEAFGVQFLTDTCWCSIREPVIPRKSRVIMTNSGKYIHYGPGLTGKQFCFGSLEMCIEAACTRRSTGDVPRWLQMSDDD